MPREVFWVGISCGSHHGQVPYLDVWGPVERITGGAEVISVQAVGLNPARRYRYRSREITEICNASARTIGFGFVYATEEEARAHFNDDRTFLHGIGLRFRISVWAMTVPEPDDFRPRRLGP